MEAENSRSRVDLNMKERQRRMRMKELHFRLATLISPHPSELSVPEVLERATSHVKQLHGRLEELKRRKALLVRDDPEDCVVGNDENGSLLVMDVRALDSNLEINLSCGSKKKFCLTLQQAVSVLVEEGAEICSATYQHVGNRVFCTINSQAVIARVGVETSTVERRLKQLLF